MSTTTSMRPPGEEDLQKLYNDVLAGFGEEPSSTDQSSIRTSNERDLYSLYSSYAAGEDEESLKSSQVKNHVSPSPTSATTPYATSPRDRPLPDPRDSPTQMSGRPRRLPPLPGTAASPTSATSMTMPEPHPHPYKHDSADS
ncbi:hypothetical protein PLICRDRAFT_308883 [Plicaturopsis crispa FD-325 SS-3]|nr:hypothetical protein PLICRDRAFT_308883 [Plicaturopsis crispa FD-325 SS-3]